MKKITYYKLTYGIGIVLVIALNILLHFLSGYLEPKDQSLNGLIYIVSFVSLVIIVLYCWELGKTSQIVKSEKINYLSNRIKFHQEQIDSYKKLLEKTEQDY
jgi:predicted PurR-regulated permease PerM